MVTEACGASVPRLQLKLLPPLPPRLQVLGVTVAQGMPPRGGSVAVSMTFIAAAGLLTTMVKLAWPPLLKLPLLLVTFNCAGGVQVSIPDAVAERPVAVA